jgi:peptide/nickel transport system permease protein
MPIYLYIIRRIVMTIPLVIGITVVAFIITNALPADPVSVYLPQTAQGKPEIVEAFRREWGLDKSLPEQYLTWVGNLLQGNMGKSIRTRRPVTEDLQQYLPATIELATSASIFGLVSGVSLGVVSAVWRGRIIDYVSRVFALIGVSFPVFVLALVGLAVLHVQWGLVAGHGRIDVVLDNPPYVTGLFTIDSLLSGQWALFTNAISHLILPSLVLGSFTAGLIARITRSSLLEVLGMDFIRTAHSKGLSDRVVIIQHGLSNALIPVVTIIGLSYGSLLAGSVLTESIFAWPGIGRYAFLASTSQDFPAIMGVTMTIALIYVGVNFIIDILYFFLDPRVRAT